ncbi:unnamed protein product [Brassica oleracea var. botrytis]
MEACGNETSTSINVASSSPLKPPTTESTRVFNQTPEKQPFNLKNQDPGQTQSSPSSLELDVFIRGVQSGYRFGFGSFKCFTNQDYFITVKNMIWILTLCRWSVYVKKCHEMILFLTASALAFLPIRFMIDEYTKCGSILCVQHYVEGVHTLLGDFKKLDPFILFALAYAGFYILSSGSFSPPPLCGFLRHRQSYSVSAWSLC